MSEQRTVPGRTRITSRAIDRVVTHATGEAFGSTGDSVHVDVEDLGGSLDLAIRTAIRVGSLDRVQAEPTAIERMGGSIIDRCAAAEQSIRDRVHHVTGYDVGRVTVHLTGVHISEERRVR